MKKPSERPVTIREVAKGAGVSTATVSLALRGHARIGHETRERVEAVARRLGYRRNPAFAILGAMSHRHDASRDGLPLGYVRERNEAGRDVRVADQVAGMRRRCGELGYRLEEYLLDDFGGPGAFARMVYNRGLSGLVLGHLRDEAVLAEQVLERVALVGCGVFRKILPINRVRASRYAGSKRAVEEVHARGYRRILVFNIEHTLGGMEEDHARYAGVQAAIHCIGKISGGWIRIEPRPPGADPELWRKPILKHQPDAVVGFNSSDLGFVRAAGFAVPGDLGFAAQEVTEPEVSGLRVAGVAGREEDMGAAAVDWLDQLIRLGRFGLPEVPISQVFDPTWIEGGSLGGKGRKGQ